MSKQIESIEKILSEYNCKAERIEYSRNLRDYQNGGWIVVLEGGISLVGKNYKDIIYNINNFFGY